MPEGGPLQNQGLGDLVQPFLLEVPGFRGRLVRLGPVLDRILSAHAYPEPVAKLLAEMLVLGAGLSSALKFDGIFTLQTKGDGPVPMVVVDMTNEGALRGYAEFDEARLDALVGVYESQEPSGQPTAEALLGKGYLAFTVDQGPETERYQGIVELTGPTLADCVLHYFRQSEQIKAGIKLAATRGAEGWRAGALLLQEMPEDQETDVAVGSDQEDDWRRAIVLMSSCSEAELLDPGLPVNDLLYRLFHQERVRVFRPKGLAFGCRCSKERITRIIGSLPREEVETMKVEGEVVVTCQFCSSSYRLDQESLKRIYAS